MLSQIAEVPTVSVLIPCRNERAYIESCVRSILAQVAPEGGFEIIVLDGMSTDDTREVLARLQGEYPALRVLDNPGRIVSTALNTGLQAARGDIVVRIDAHTVYAPDYLRECVEVLRETRADNVGGPWRAVGVGYVGRAIAAAFHSRLTSGGALAHNVTHEGPVDTVYLGCWRKEVLERLGGFDEELVRNQDDELNLRIVRGGGTVWQSTRINSWYCPRASIRRLFRQYMQYGYWKVRVIQKHRLPASWRHLVPPVFVLVMAALIVASTVSPGARVGALLVSTTYSVALVGAAIMTAKDTEWILLPVLPVVIACFHFGYGIGFFYGVWDFIIRRRAPSRRMSSLTRAATLRNSSSMGARQRE